MLFFRGPAGFYVLPRVRVVLVGRSTKVIPGRQVLRAATRRGGLIRRMRVRPDGLKKMSRRHRRRAV